jgi:hypothetical protein
MMFKKPKAYLTVAAVIAALALPAGLVGASAPAGASTAACGDPCTSLSVQSEGTTEYLTVSGSSSSGYTVGLATASTTNDDQDFTPLSEGTVPNAVQWGVLPPRWEMNYSAGTLVEYEWAPGGDPSGQCLADGVDQATGLTFDGAGVDGSGQTDYEPDTSVTLATCSLSTQTLWIIDPFNNANVPGYDDLISAGYATDPDFDNYAAEGSLPSGNDVTPFFVPDVLTVNSSGKVVLSQLSQLGSNVSSGQMWTGYTAPDQGALRKAIAKSAAAARSREADGFF